MDDPRKVMAELPESHREIQDGNAPDPGEHGTHGMQRVIDDYGRSGDRDNSKAPCDDAVVVLARIEVLLEGIGVALETCMRRIARPQRPPLLEQQGRE